MKIKAWGLIFFGVGYCTTITAQNTGLTSDTYIYSLTPDQALFYYEEKPSLVDLATLLPPIDSIANPAKWTSQASGQFLLVNIRDGQFHWEIRQHTSLHAYTVNNRRSLSVQVLGGAGKPVQNASVQFEGKHLIYQADQGVYLWHGKRKEGYLRVDFQGQTAFFQVSNELNQSPARQRWVRFRRTLPGKILLTPVITVSRAAQFISRGIRYGDWYWRVHKSRRYTGYIALNKPRYLPGDTLKMKAYVAKANGKSVGKSVELRITDLYYGGNPVFTKKLSPEKAPGTYDYEWVVSDSLKLNKSYSLALMNPRRGFQYTSIVFSYEDYLLDEITYTLDTDKKDYEWHQPIEISAEGKDQNGFTIPDGKVRLVMLRDRVTQFRDSLLWIPDTLWAHAQELRAEGPTVIVIPDSVLPAADLAIRLRALFNNSNGELKSKEVPFNIHLPKPELRLEGDTLIADFEKSTTGILVQNFGDHYPMKVDTIPLPYRLLLNPATVDYSLKVGDQNAHFSPKSVDAMVAFGGNRMKDTLFVQWQNGRNLSIGFTIFEGDKIAKQGRFSDSIFTYQCPVSSNAPFFVQYQYIWGGEPEGHTEKFPFYASKLEVQTNLPEKINPGEKTLVKVSVTDAKGKPAKGTHLAAGAINAQFNSSGNYKGPTVSYKIANDPINKAEFELADAHQSSTSDTLSEAWLRALHLDSTTYYKLRFATDGVIAISDTVQTDSFSKTWAQFAPYVVKNGQFQSVYLIYCNRKLVYCYDTDGQTPYSFLGVAGKNLISIRTRNGEYTLKDVVLEPGKKVEIAVNEDHWRQSAWADRIEYLAMPAYFNAYEKSLLNNQLFLLKNQPLTGSVYLWQKNTPVHVIDRFAFSRNYKKALKIGPFNANAPLQFSMLDGFRTEFQFEPGFSYEVQRQRERLYEQQAYEKKQRELPLALPVRFPGQKAITPATITPQTNRLQGMKFSAASVTVSKNIPTGGFLLDYDSNQDSMTLVVIAWMNEDSVLRFYNPATRYWSGIPAGSYQLLFINTTGQSYAKKEITIHPDSLHCVRWKHLSFTVDTAREVIRSILMKNNPGVKFPILGHHQREQGNLSGYVNDENGEAVIFSNILLYKNGVLLAGTTTDFEGYYVFEGLAPGNYDIEVSYTGYQTKLISNVIVLADISNIVDLTMYSSDISLQEVMVVGYAVPLIQQDNTASAVITSDQIKGLPTRNISSLKATLAGRAAGMSREEINIRGSRTTPANYYIDGIRISGGEAVADITWNPRSRFIDEGFWMPEIVTDRQGTAYFNVQFPDNITSWNTFVLGMDAKGRGGISTGQTKAFKTLLAQLAVPRFLVEGDSSVVIGKVVHLAPDSILVNTHFKQGTIALPGKETTTRQGFNETLPITTKIGILDSLKVAYFVQSNDVQDGEERKIPVLPKGTTATTGAFWLLEKDTTFTIHSLEGKGPLHLYAENNIQDLLLQDLASLRDYPYDCNEQTASKLIGLLLEKDIRIRTGTPFAYEKLLRLCLARLSKGQQPDGGWGWWPNNPSTIWMTAYVLDALRQAKEQGYSSEAYEKGLRFITAHLTQLNDSDLLRTLSLLSATGQNMDYEHFLAPFDKQPLSLYDRLTVLYLRQCHQLPHTLDSLYYFEKQTALGGSYWGEDTYVFADNRTATTLLAYQIAQKAGDTALQQRIRRFFLEQRSAHGWRNTIETAQILKVVLSDNISENTTPNRLRINGKEATLPTAEVLSENGAPLSIQFSGKGPVYFTAYQQYRETTPEPAKGLFAVKTTLLQNNRETMQLQKDLPATLQVEVTTEKAADYVMIEVPIPAGCSYFNTPQEGSWLNEIHREYRKDQTAIFCEHLAPGTHVFTIELEPRFTGHYTLNPAKAELMYFPVMSGREGLKVVGIRSN